MEIESCVWKTSKLIEIADETRELFEPLNANALPYIGLEHIEQKTLQLNGIGISTDTVSNKKTELFI